MNSLKIYRMECSWRGSIVVVATDKQRARELMRQSIHNYEDDNLIEEHEIEEGLTLIDLGDC